MVIKIPVNLYPKELPKEAFEAKVKQRLIDDQIISNGVNVEFLPIPTKMQAVIIDEIKSIVFFTQKTNFGKTKSRNTFISQNIIPVIRKNKELNYQVYIALNPLDGKIPLLSDSIKKDIMCLNTYGFITTDRFNLKDKFNSLESFIKIKNQISEKNNSNDSSYIFKVYDTITYYLKMHGESFKNSILEILCLVHLLDEKSFCVLALDNGNAYAIKEFMQDAEFSKIKILEDQNFKNEVLFSNHYGVEDVKRNQQKFIKNIVNKYENIINCNKCFACDYEISDNLIASHIDRVTDIINKCKANLISVEQAKELIVSGDNGFLLCPNHDKEFEKGYIYYDYDKMTFAVKDDLPENIKTSIEKTLTKKIIFPKQILNLKMIQNIENHQQRTGNLKPKVKMKM